MRWLAIDGAGCHGRPAMTVLASALLVLALFAAFVFVLAAIATVRHLRRPVTLRPDEALPPVSLLKPLKGHEEELAENLRSFYRQDYPAFEVVFATTDADDPALPVARRVANEFPRVPTRFVRSDPSFGLNPKVSNLAGALAAAEHELVLQSDANVSVRPGYLRTLVSELLQEEARLSSSLVVGYGERSLGALFHNLQLSAFTAPGCCFALTYAGIVCVIGKSMLFYRSDLEELGGLEPVRDLLAEDYILGQAFERAGRKAILSRTTVDNRNVHASVEHFLGRHARWLKMRAVVHVPGFFLDLGGNTVGLGLLAAVASGFDPAFVLAWLGLVLFKGVGDVLLVGHIRGRPVAPRHWAFVPLRDLAMLALWPYAAVSRSVEWRGERRRLGARSRLYPDRGALPLRWVRRLLRSA
jgi:ceramide glucosyltransferase